MAEEEKKFIICPNCGVLLEKGISFCGYCGSSVEEKKEELQQQFQQTPISATQYTYEHRDPKRHAKYASITSELGKQAQAESKITTARILALLAFCLGSVFGIVLAIVSLVFSFQAKKIVGSNIRITYSIILAIVSGILGIVELILIIFFRGGFG